MSASTGPMSAVGVDVIEIERVEAALGRFGERFLRRGYTGGGGAFWRGRGHELAARFAAKEAVMKALGTGAKGVAWREIEVLPNHRGKPLVYLYGRAKARAERIGLGGVAAPPWGGAGRGVATLARAGDPGSGGGGRVRAGGPGAGAADAAGAAP